MCNSSSTIRLAAIYCCTSACGANFIALVVSLEDWRTSTTYSEVRCCTRSRVFNLTASTTSTFCSGSLLWKSKDGPRHLDGGFLAVEASPPFARRSAVALVHAVPRISYPKGTITSVPRSNKISAICFSIRPGPRSCGIICKASVISSLSSKPTCFGGTKYPPLSSTARNDNTF